MAVGAGIRHALSSIILANCILGLITFGRSRFHVNLLYIGVFWVLYFYVFFRVVLIMSLPDKLIFMLGAFSLYMNIITSFASAYYNLKYKKKFYSCLSDLDVVNDTLRSFGIKAEYNELETSTKKLILIMGTVFFVITGINCYDIHGGITNIEASGMCLISNFPFLINSVVYLTFGICFGYVGGRFDRLNNYVQKLLDEILNQRSMKKRPVQIAVCNNPFRSADRKRNLWTIIHLHQQLCKTSQELNSVFAKQMMLGIACLFVFLWGVGIFTYQVLNNFDASFFLKNRKLYLMLHVSAVVSIVKLVISNLMYENVSAKANETKVILQNVVDVLQEYETCKELMRIMLYKMRKPMKFTAMGMSVFGYETLRKFWSSLTTMTFFIIQTYTVSFVPATVGEKRALISNKTQT